MAGRPHSGRDELTRTPECTQASFNAHAVKKQRRFQARGQPLNLLKPHETRGTSENADAKGAEQRVKHENTENAENTTSFRY